MSKTILQEAEELVGGDRQKDYGDTQKNFGRIAGLWGAYLGVEITPKDVGMLMILMKVSRGRNSDKRDTLVDIAGYAHCLDMLTHVPRDGAQRMVEEWEGGAPKKIPVPSDEVKQIVTDAPAGCHRCGGKMGFCRCTL